MEEKAMMMEAVNFVSILPKLFSDDFDRKTLWERIGNGINSSYSKCGGDFQNFVNLMLEFIKADSGKVAANQDICYFIESMDLRPEEWISGFLQIMSKKHFIILVKARSKWNSEKKVSA